MTRYLDHLPSRRLARAARAVVAWLQREDNDLLALAFWIAAVLFVCWGGHAAVSAKRYTIQKVSAALRTSGLTFARWSSSGMVRGWGDWRSGYKVERDRTTGKICISYRDARWADVAHDAHRARINAAINALEAKGIEWELFDNEAPVNWLITVEGNP